MAYNVNEEALMNKITNGKIEVNKKRAAAYVVIALLGLWFIYFYDRVFSLAFITAMLTAAAASYATTLLSAAEVYAGLELSCSIADKGEEVRMTLTVKSGKRLPIPFFYVNFYNEWLLTGGGTEQYVISVSAAKPGVITKSYKAEIWGTSCLGVSDLAIHDYLGLFKITYSGRCDMPSASVSIRPALRESFRNDYLAYICTKMISEEKEDGHSVKQSFMSQPGYQHRVYVPGDPLKLINWKLSARLDKFMVRESEFLKTRVPVFIIDRAGLRHLAQLESLQEAVVLEERVVEAVLAMLDSMIKQNISCKVYYYSGNAWFALDVENNEHIMALRNTFSHYVFDSFSGLRLPAGVTAESGMIAVFTCALDGTLLSEISAYADSSASVDVICPAGSYEDYDDLWYVNEAYDFFK